MVFIVNKQRRPILCGEVVDSDPSDEQLAS
jgi:hypothetical protein